MLTHFLYDILAAYMCATVQRRGIMAKTKNVDSMSKCKKKIFAKHMAQLRLPQWKGPCDTSFTICSSSNTRSRANHSASSTLTFSLPRKGSVKGQSSPAS